MEDKIYVLDTTVLIEAPDYMYRGEGMFVIPTAVIKEIDGLKNSDQKEVAAAARKVARTLDTLGSYGNLTSGVRLSTGGTLRVYTNYVEIDDLNSKNDNRIVGTAMALKKETDSDVKLVTTDINMRTVARAHGIKAEIPDCVSVIGENADIKMVNNTTNDLKRRIKRAGVIAIVSGISALVIMLMYLAHIPSRHSIFSPLLIISLGSAVWWGGYYFFLKSPTMGENKTENGSSNIGPKEVFDPRYSGLGCNIYRDE